MDWLISCAGLIIIMLVAVVSHNLQCVADVVIHFRNGFKFLLKQTLLFFRTHPHLHKESGGYQPCKEICEQENVKTRYAFLQHQAIKSVSDRAD